ncbi:MAG: DUF3579 domain-containing protein [Gammaproteobacteria bacterium]|nr:DUF3579 domain-containing protein [Gammaproteobacteria bacterium]
MAVDNEFYVIYGKDAKGRPLRPSDWVERICSTFASFNEDHRLCYSPALKPGIISGEKCLLVSRQLGKTNPEICRYLSDFVTSNHLQVHPLLDNGKVDTAVVPLAHCA